MDNNDNSGLDDGNVQTPEQPSAYSAAMNVDSTLEASRTRGVNGAGQHEAANSAAMEVEPVTEVSVLSGVPFRGPLPLKKVVGHKGSSSVSDPTKPRNKVKRRTRRVTKQGISDPWMTQYFQKNSRQLNKEIEKFHAKRDLQKDNNTQRIQDCLKTPRILEDGSEILDDDLRSLMSPNEPIRFTIMAILARTLKRRVEFSNPNTIIIPTDYTYPHKKLMNNVCPVWVWESPAQSTIDINRNRHGLFPLMLPSHYVAVYFDGENRQFTVYDSFIHNANQNTYMFCDSSDWLKLTTGDKDVNNFERFVVKLCVCEETIPIIIKKFVIPSLVRNSAEAEEWTNKSPVCHVQKEKDPINSGVFALQIAYTILVSGPITDALIFSKDDLLQCRLNLVQDIIYENPGTYGNKILQNYLQSLKNTLFSISQNPEMWTSIIGNVNEVICMKSEEWETMFSTTGKSKLECFASLGLNVELPMSTEQLTILVELMRITYGTKECQILSPKYVLKCKVNNQLHPEGFWSSAYKKGIENSLFEQYCVDLTRRVFHIPYVTYKKRGKCGYQGNHICIELRKRITPDGQEMKTIFVMDPAVQWNRVISGDNRDTELCRRHLILKEEIKKALLPYYLVRTYLGDRGKKLSYKLGNEEEINSWQIEFVDYPEPFQDPTPFECGILCLSFLENRLLNQKQKLSADVIVRDPIRKTHEYQRMVLALSPGGRAILKHCLCSFIDFLNSCDFINSMERARKWGQRQEQLQEILQKDRLKRNEKSNAASTTKPAVCSLRSSAAVNDRMQTRASIKLLGKPSKVLTRSSSKQDSLNERIPRRSSRLEQSLQSQPGRNVRMNERESTNPPMLGDGSLQVATHNPFAELPSSSPSLENLDIESREIPETDPFVPMDTSEPSPEEQTATKADLQMELVTGPETLITQAGASQSAPYNATLAGRNKNNSRNVPAPKDASGAESELLRKDTLSLTLPDLNRSQGPQITPEAASTVMTGMPPGPQAALGTQSDSGSTNRSIPYRGLQHKGSERRPGTMTWNPADFLGKMDVAWAELRESESKRRFYQSESGSRGTPVAKTSEIHVHTDHWTGRVNMPVKTFTKPVILNLPGNLPRPGLTPLIQKPTIPANSTAPSAPILRARPPRFDPKPAIPVDGIMQFEHFSTRQ